MTPARSAFAAILIASWLGAPAYCAGAQLGRTAYLRERVDLLEAENAQLRRKMESLDGSVKKALDDKTATYDRLYRRTTEELDKQKTMWTSMIVLYVGLVLGCSALLTYLGWRIAAAKIRDAVARRVQELVTSELVRREVGEGEQQIAGALEPTDRAAGRSPEQLRCRHEAAGGHRRTKQTRFA